MAFQRRAGGSAGSATLIPIASGCCGTAGLSGQLFEFMVMANSLEHDTIRGRTGGLQQVSAGWLGPAFQSPIAPVLYLPIEALAHEFDSRLLLSCLAVESGMTVIIGQKQLMLHNIPWMRPGIILFNTLTTGDAGEMRLARDNGYRIAAIDEEAPGFIAKNEGLHWVSREAVDASDVVFAVGSEHRDFLAERFPCDDDKYVVAGNPRWDLLRPEFLHRYDDEVKRIQREHGRFFLISTNLDLTNSDQGSLETVIRKLENAQRLDRRRQADRYYIGEHLILEVGSQNGFHALLRMLPKRFPHHRFIVRPRATENASAWERIALDTPQVIVANRGSIIPWIIAADALVHTYSATGVEAFALGKPAISFRPTYSHILENYLSSQVNTIASTPEQVMAQLQRIVERNARSYSYPPEFRTVFERHFAAQRGPLASEMIIRALRSKFASDSSANDQHWQLLPRYRRRMLMKSHDARLASELHRPVIVERLAWFGRQLGCARSPTVEDCGEHLFLLRQERP